MAQTVNEKLAVEAVRRRIMLLRYGNQEAQDLLMLLRKANPRIAAAMLEGLEGMNASNTTPARLRALSRLLLNETTDAYTAILKKLNDDMEKFGTSEAVYHAATLRNAIPTAVLRLLDTEVKATSWQQVLASVSSRAVMGTTLDQWFSTKLPQELAANLISALQQGIIQGVPTTQLVSQVRKGGVWANHERNLATVTHTAINFIAADARELTRKANSDLIKERQWLSTLDNKTSTICIVRDSLRYTAETPVEPIGHKIPYGAGPGKIHFRCRSTETWIVKSFRELGIPVDELTEGIRASMNGEVPASMNYLQWLQEKASPRVQEEVLGVTRADMLRAGKFKAEDFYDNGQMIPLSKLLELDKRDGL